MVKIPWFSSNIINMYCNEMMKKLPDKIVWCSIDKDYSIDTRSLLVETRKSLLEDHSFVLYLTVCELIYIAKNFKVNDFLFSQIPPLKQNMDNREWARESLLAPLKQLDFEFYSYFVERHPEYTRRKKSFNDFISDISHSLNSSLAQYLADGMKTIYEYMDDKTRYTVISSLGVECCPYCNRQYITNWADKDSLRATADLDHFYPKKHFPLFALSLFNFVPSCQICNSRMKTSKYADMIYPFEEEFGDESCFIVKYDDTVSSEEIFASIYGNASLAIELTFSEDINTPKSKRIKASKEIFNLEALYQSHIGYVRELLLKKRIYQNSSYLKGINEVLKEKEIHYNEEQLERFLYGFNWENGCDPNRPLSKLTYDIIKK